MALPPTIPTSFVPYSATGQTTKRFRADFVGAFEYFAYALLGVALLLAIGIFAYGRILASEKEAKDAELASAEQTIDAATVDSFVRLRNRLVSSKTLLGNHMAMSGFFDTLEKILPATARLSTLHLSADGAGGVKMEGSGVAKSFNVLAALSSAFSNDGHFKDAIFSNIVVSQKDNSVSFAMTATLDSKLTAFSASGAAPATVQATAPKAPTAPAAATTTATSTRP